MKMLSRQQLEKLNKTELVSYALNLSDIHDKLNEIEKGVSARFELLETEFNEKIEKLKLSNKTETDKLEGELAIAKNANTVLRSEFDKKQNDTEHNITVLEREAYRTAEYVNYETLEISKIPSTIPDDEVPEVTLAILNSLSTKDYADITLDDVHAIHRRQGQYTREKVLVKFIGRSDAYRTLRNSFKLRKMNVKNIDGRLESPIYVNEHLSPYYAKLRYACKLLHEQGLLNEYWVSGHKVKVKSINDEVKQIGHKIDLINLTKGDVNVDISDILIRCKL